MKKYKGQLELSDMEVAELEDNPQLLHLYNARFIWEDLKRAQKLHEALQRISLIPDKTGGGDWDEIEEAREIVRTALKESRKWTKESE